MKNIFKIVGINLCVLIGLCIVIEIVLRVAKIGYGSAPLEHSPVFHHVHPKNYSYLNYSAQKEFSNPIYYDNQGLLRQIYIIRLIRKTYNVWKAKQE